MPNVRPNLLTRRHGLYNGVCVPVSYISLRSAHNAFVGKEILGIRHNLRVWLYFAYGQAIALTSPSERRMLQASVQKQVAKGSTSKEGSAL